MKQLLVLCTAVTLLLQWNSVRSAIIHSPSQQLHETGVQTKSGSSTIFVDDELTGEVDYSGFMEMSGEEHDNIDEEDDEEDDEEVMNREKDDSLQSSSVKRNRRFIEVMLRHSRSIRNKNQIENNEVGVHQTETDREMSRDSEHPAELTEDVHHDQDITTFITTDLPSDRDETMSYMMDENSPENHRDSRLKRDLNDKIKHHQYGGSTHHHQCPSPAQVHVLTTLTSHVPYTVYHTRVVPLTSTHTLSMLQHTTVTFVSTVHTTTPSLIDSEKTPTLPLTITTTHVRRLPARVTVTARVRHVPAVTSHVTSTRVHVLTEYRDVVWTSTMLVRHDVVKTQHHHNEVPIFKIYTKTSVVRITVADHITRTNYITRTSYVKKHQPDVTITEYRHKYVTITSQQPAVTITSLC